MVDKNKNRREIVLITKSEDKAGSRWSIIERAAPVFSAVAIPLLIALGGWWIQKQLQNQAVSRDYVQIAVSILKEPDKAKVNPELRSWAVDLLNENSPMKFSPEVAQKLKSGDITLPGPSPVKVDTTIDKSEVSINLRNGEKLSYKLTDITGAAPTINLACAHRTLWNETSQSLNFERDWPRNPAEIDFDDDTYRFGVSFSGDSKFTIVVQHIDKGGKVLEVLKSMNEGGGGSAESIETSIHVHVSR